MASKRICSIVGCGKRHYGRGWCQSHYARWWASGGDPAVDRRRKRQFCSVAGCNKSVFGYGWCSKHYQRWRSCGDTTLTKKTATGAPHEWLAKALVYDGDDCLVWPFGKTPNGYGTVSVNGVDMRVNRVVCEKVHGPPPSPKHQAAHSCGNSSCANPKHLRWATRSENESDKLRHGTSNRGQRNGQSKLSQSDVAEIRSLSGALPQREIAKRFGISQQTVSEIALGKGWAWLR